MGAAFTELGTKGSETMLRLNLRLLAIIALLLTITAISSGGCKKKPATQAVVTVDTVKEDLVLDSTLVSRIPENSFAFFRFDSTSPAYSRLLASPWGKKDISFLAKQHNSRMAELYTVMTAFGLNPEDRASWSKVVPEIVFFAARPAAGQPMPVFGAVFRAGAEDFKARFASGREALARLNDTVQDLTLVKGSGFSVVLKDDQGRSGPWTLFFAADSEMGFIATNKELLDALQQQQGCAVPGFVHDAAVQRTVLGIPKAEQRFGLGLLDIRRLIEAKQGSTGPEVSADQKAFQAFVIAFGMDEVPLTVARVSYDQNYLGADSLIKALQLSSAQGLLAYAPEKPLIFLSVDGATLKGIKNAALKTQDAEVPAAAGLDFVDGVERLALLASVAPLGQAMLPVPDLAFVIKTKDAAGLQKRIETAITGSLGGNPATAGMSWTEKDIDGSHKMKAIVSPLQMGAFLAAKDDLVFLTSTESQIKDAFSGRLKGQFMNALAGQSRAVLIDAPSVASMYLDFEELGKFLENMKGMLSMFAPQNQSTASLLSAETLQALSQRGQMVGWLNSQPGAIELRYTYQLSKKPS